MKRVLYGILGGRRVTEEVLGTTLCLVEQALNSRPITPVSTDSREISYANAIWSRWLRE